MSISRSDDRRLRLGNLLLAALFSVVPTAMTIGFLGIHGYLLCKNLDERLDMPANLQAKELCLKSNLDVNYSYIIWIWMFITIPTWRWFYYSHHKKLNDDYKNKRH